MMHRVQNTSFLKAWLTKVLSSSAVVLVVVQQEERYMYDQYWITVALKERYPSHLAKHKKIEEPYDLRHI
jgi:hypothetical protein